MPSTLDCVGVIPFVDTWCFTTFSIFPSNRSEAGVSRRSHYDAQVSKLKLFMTKRVGQPSVNQGLKLKKTYFSKYECLWVNESMMENKT